MMIQRLNYGLKNRSWRNTNEKDHSYLHNHSGRRDCGYYRLEHPRNLLENNLCDPHSCDRGSCFMLPFEPLLGLFGSEAGIAQSFCLGDGRIIFGGFDIRRCFVSVRGSFLTNKKKFRSQEKEGFPKNFFLRNSVFLLFQKFFLCLHRFIRQNS